MASDKITTTQILLPVLLLSTAFAGFLVYQTSLLTNEHDSLKQTYAQQTEPLAQVDKIKAQLNALAVGTLKLSEQGDKNAQTIIDALKKAGINVDDRPAQGIPAAPPGMTQPSGKPNGR